jgi:hypothetical protein
VVGEVSFDIQGLGPRSKPSHEGEHVNRGFAKQNDYQKVAGHSESRRYPDVTTIGAPWIKQGSMVISQFVLPPVQ